LSSSRTLNDHVTPTAYPADAQYHNICQHGSYLAGPASGVERPLSPKVEGPSVCAEEYAIMIRVIPLKDRRMVPALWSRDDLRSNWLRRAR